MCADIAGCPSTVCVCVCICVCVYSPPWLRITDLTKPGQGLPNKYQPVSGSPQIPQGKVYQQVGLRLKSPGETHWNSIIMFSRVIESDFARKTFKGKTKDYNYYENYWCSFHYSTIFELATDNPFYKRRKVVFLAFPSSWHLPASCFSLNTFVSVSVKWTQVQQRSGTSREWWQPCHSWGFLNGPQKTRKEGFFSIWLHWKLCSDSSLSGSKELPAVVHFPLLVLQTLATWGVVPSPGLASLVRQLEM